MRNIGLAIILAAGLMACVGKENRSDSGGVGASAPNMRGAASLQSKVAIGGTAAASPIYSSARAAGVVMDAAEVSEPAPVPPATPNRTEDALQGVDYATTAANTMIIRTGQAFIEVQKVDPAILKVRELVARAGGYITNSSISGGRDQIRQASIEIKIPNTKYDEAVGSLSSIGKVETVNSNAQDVGEEFVDVTARVANARRLEERLIDLLARRTGKLDEVLRVERELARVREEIERYEGRLRYLSARVAMSTLTINVHEPAPIIEPGQSPIADAFRRAWQNFVAMVAAFIASLGVLIPIGLIGIGGWIGYRRWVLLSRRRVGTA
ncbi:MAG TPA: DUF4349 domain-containing protein [Gemmatimonadaceae bacterium]|jgi:hypothetical protein|nr:DUF4349 domain-containing protein [Gemmatimonadaceae bacterium]